MIPFTVDFSDMANNAGTQVTAVANDADGGVTFDKQAPSFTTVTMSSNNSTSTLAIVNDVITINLTSDEAIKASFYCLIGRKIYCNHIINYCKR